MKLINSILTEQRVFFLEIGILMVKTCFKETGQFITLTQ